MTPRTRNEFLASAADVREIVLAIEAAERRATVEAPRIKAALAALEWFETTHGNEFGHDHHCPAGKWESPGEGTRADGSTYPLSAVQVETGKPCTCGWGPFQEALAILDAERDR